MHKIIVITITLLLIAFTIPMSIQAQSATPLDCGSTVNVETSPSTPEVNYLLRVPAGTEISVTVTPVGSTLNVYFVLYDAGDNEIIRVNSETSGGTEALPQPFVLGVSNPRVLVFGTEPYRNDTFFGPRTAGRVFGAFRVDFNCVGVTPEIIQTLPPVPSNCNFCMHPLPVQDFSVGVTLPLQPNQANTGSISPGFQGIFGYTFDANAGDSVDLTFIRQLGNLSLGLAVINTDGTVAFHTSLIGANNLNATFPISVSGTYTIGIYIISISAPTTPENTSFTIQATIN